MIRLPYTAKVNGVYSCESQIRAFLANQKEDYLVGGVN